MHLLEQINLPGTENSEIGKSRRHKFEVNMKGDREAVSIGSCDLQANTGYFNV